MISILQRGVLGAPQTSQDKIQQSNNEWRQKYDAMEGELSNSLEKIRQKDIYIEEITSTLSHQMTQLGSLQRELA